MLVRVGAGSRLISAWLFKTLHIETFATTILQPHQQMKGSSCSSGGVSMCFRVPLLQRCTRRWRRANWRGEAALPPEWRQPLVSFHSSKYFWWSLCLLMFTVTTLIKELGYHHRTVFAAVCLLWRTGSAVRLFCYYIIYSFVSVFIDKRFS